MVIYTVLAYQIGLDQNVFIYLKITSGMMVVCGRALTVLCLGILRPPFD